VVIRVEGYSKSSKPREKVVLACFIDRPQVRANFEEELSKASVDILSRVLLTASLINPGEVES
jgi:hypothetical protein